MPWIFSTKQVYTPASFNVKLLTLNTDWIVTVTPGVVVTVYFDPESMTAPLNSHLTVGVGSAEMLHEKVADRPIGTPAFRGPPTIMAAATERGEERDWG